MVSASRRPTGYSRRVERTRSTTVGPPVGVARRRDHAGRLVQRVDLARLRPPRPRRRPRRRSPRRRRAPGRSPPRRRPSRGPSAISRSAARREATPAWARYLARRMAQATRSGASRAGAGGAPQGSSPRFFGVHRVVRAREHLVRRGQILEERDSSARETSGHGAEVRRGWPPPGGRPARWPPPPRRPPGHRELVAAERATMSLSRQPRGSASRHARSARGRPPRGRHCRSRA